MRHHPFLLLQRTNHSLIRTPNRLGLLLKLHVRFQILVGLLDDIFAALFPVLRIVLRFTLAARGLSVDFVGVLPWLRLVCLNTIRVHLLVVFKQAFRPVAILLTPLSEVVQGTLLVPRLRTTSPCERKICFSRRALLLCSHPVFVICCTEKPVGKAAEVTALPQAAVRRKPAIEPGRWGSQIHARSLLSSILVSLQRGSSHGFNLASGERDNLLESTHQLVNFHLYVVVARV